MRIAQPGEYVLEDDPCLPVSLSRCYSIDPTSTTREAFVIIRLLLRRHRSYPERSSERLFVPSPVFIMRVVSVCIRGTAADSQDIPGVRDTKLIPVIVISARNYLG